MINSMTGFGGKEIEVSSFGKISVELRSSNHKFLEVVLHMPEGFLSLEDKIKKEIEEKTKRGRVVCAVRILGGENTSAIVNYGLLKNYVASLKKIQERFHIKDEARIDTLINLPGVLSSVENNISKAEIWPYLRKLVNRALDDLVRTRQKEGRALSVYLKKGSLALKRGLGIIDTRFKKVIKEKIAKINTDEERVAFLKNTDISEETQRLAFHIRNFMQKLSKSSPVGKELDFIAQEMQREANTIGAKSCDSLISASVVQIKSQIEKIREQVQNIE